MSITTYYLEMNSVNELLEKKKSQGLIVTEVQINEFRMNKFLYQFIGEPWQWEDKLTWTDKDWENYVNNPNLRTWVAYYKGSIAGYFELQNNGVNTTEVVYFGLAAQFIGKGFGGYLLSQAIVHAWKVTNTKRVFVHTCSLDHASALANYKARGFNLYNTETQ